MSWTTRPTLAAFTRFLASAATAILDQISSLTAPGWTSWTLAWTSDGTAPAKGNATVLAEYRQPAGSDMVDACFVITFGSTSTFGTGRYFFSLPVPAHANMVSVPIGTAWTLDAGVKETAGVVKCESATTVRVSSAPTAAGTADNWGATVPYTFGNADSIRVNVRYRVA